MKIEIKLVLCFAIFDVSLWNVWAGGSDEPGTNQSDLTLTLHYTNAVFKVGDEIPVEFVISNAGTMDWTRYAMMTEVGWTEKFALTVKTVDGKTLPDPGTYYPEIVEGLGGITTVLHPGESFTKILPLNFWAAPRSSGEYLVTGIYRNTSRPSLGVRSTPMAVTVLPRTEAEMAAYVNDLTNRASVDWMRLAFTGSPKMVPCLLNGMYHGGNAFWIANALTAYLPHTAGIKAELIKATLKMGLTDNMIDVLKQYDLSDKEWVSLIARSLREDSPETWSAGAGMAVGGYYDDTFTPRLIAMATGEDKARDNAIWALAMNRTDASVQTLKALLKNPDEDVRLKTEEAICIAYCYRGIYHGRKLRPDDFDKKFQEPSTYQGLVEGKSKP